MNFEEARESAMLSAMDDLRGLFSGPRSEVLESEYLETDHCWMFFRQHSIKIPPERALSDFAYVFSKHTGEGRCVPNYFGNPAKLQSYLDLISKYFASRIPVGDSSV